MMISSVNNNVTFGNRYLNVIQMERLPQKIADSIYKSDAIDSYIQAGKPKTLLGKFIDLFRRDEMINVHYQSANTSKVDKHAKDAVLYFLVKRGNVAKKYLKLRASQNGIKRQEGSVVRDGENHSFKEPTETVVDKLAKQILEIRDFGKELQ